jgi:hypothetical protein
VAPDVSASRLRLRSAPPLGRPRSIVRDADLWQRVVKHPLGCWEWTGPVDSFGCGVVRYEGATWLVHRLVWKLTHGRLPTQAVRRLCLIPRCVRPEHLRLGTRLQNAYAHRRFLDAWREAWGLDTSAHGSPAYQRVALAGHAPRPGEFPSIESERRALAALTT